MLKNSNFHGRRISSAVIFGGASIAAAALTPFEGSAEQQLTTSAAGSDQQPLKAVDPIDLKLQNVAAYLLDLRREGIILTHR